MNIIILEDYKNNSIEEDIDYNIFSCNKCSNTSFQFRLYSEDDQPDIVCNKCGTIINPGDIYLLD